MLPLVVRAAFCPCVVYARNAARWDHLDRHEAPHPLPGNNHAQCCGHACASLCLFSCFLNMCARSQVRERYDIRGSGGEDCANSWALYPCALHQEERELELEENAMRDMGVDGKELYEDDGVGERDRAPGFCNPCVPTSGPIGGNGCSCFLCCFMC
jgi:Cys-rich protein (TIGR01571 family)